jgi:hypothetical protein
VILLALIIVILSALLLRHLLLLQFFMRLSDEVYPRQCPCLRAFDLGSALGTWRTRRRSDESSGTREFTQVRPPWKGKGLHPACLTLY